MHYRYDVLREKFFLEVIKSQKVMKESKKRDLLAQLLNEEKENRENDGKMKKMAAEAQVIPQTYLYLLLSSFPSKIRQFLSFFPNFFSYVSG